MVAMIDRVVQRGIQRSQIYFTGLTGWKNKAEFKIETGLYTVQLAQTKEEVLEAFSLRYKIFCIEMSGPNKKSRLDYDKFDNLCDHLIIKFNPTQKIIGTYRLNFSETAKNFYTESEFEIKNWIENQKKPFVELGRACIDKDHRKGALVSLLWRGIFEYMKLMEADKLIGCTSIQVKDARMAALIYKYLETNFGLSDEIFKPKDKYEMKDLLFWLMVFSRGLSASQLQEAEDKIPPLLKSYLKAGAKVASYPAFDTEFNCIDFITVLNRNEIDSKLVRRFGV